jgi:hypothetical protein
VCHSPRLIAAYHVLHRFLVPRHPPQALSSFKLKIGFYLAKNHLKQSKSIQMIHAKLKKTKNINQ